MPRSIVVLAILLLVVCIPSMTIAKRPVSQNDIEKEIFKHVEFPCAANLAISVLKELDDEEYTRSDLKIMTAMLIQTALSKMGKTRTKCRQHGLE